jgi:hypothetical protein
VQGTTSSVGDARTAWLIAAAIAVALMLSLVLVPAVSHLAPTGGASSTPVRGTGPGPLESLPIAQQAMISATVGRESAAFDAKHVGDGWRLQGGGVDADFDTAHTTIRTGSGLLSMVLTGVGRRAPAPLSSHETLTAQGNRVTLERAAISESYSAGPLGIEQVFRVARRPAGSTPALTLAIGLGGSLRARQGHAGISFVARTGATALRYGGLRALDAAGHALPSRVRIGRGRLLIEVSDRGARYPITIDPLLQQGPKLTADDVRGEAALGDSAALSSDGDTALVGGLLDHSDVGAAWVFTRSGSTWTQQGAKLIPSDPTGAADFGTSVALSADGNTALIGGDLDNGEDGAAWVFTRAGSSWTQQASKLVGDCTGTCGGPRGTGETAAGEFGSSVALSNDGNTALIGAQGDGNAAGGAWVFTRSASSWSEQALLTGAGANGPANFGQSVSLSGDGDTALIGGPTDASKVGAAWVFLRTGTSWAPQGGKLIPNDNTGEASFGDAVSISRDGDTALIGGDQNASDAGAAWVFVRTGSAWSQQGPDLTGAGELGPTGELGTSVALSADGNTAAVGAELDNNGVGAGWLFTRTGATWTQQGSKLLGAAESGNGFFGAGVALSSDGQTLLVGGGGDAADEGAAWVFAPAAPTCNDVTVTTPAGGGPTSVVLSCTAPAGAQLTYAAVNAPAHGSLSAIEQAGARLTYTPAAGFAGTDSFTYLVSDQWGVSNIATVTSSVPPAPTHLEKQLRSTVHWTFGPTLSRYAVAQRLIVEAVPSAAKVELSCKPKRCPIKPLVTRVHRRRVCKRKGRKRKCQTITPASGNVDLTRFVAHRHLAVGDLIVVQIVEKNTVGKRYTFKIRPRRQPLVTITKIP